MVYTDLLEQHAHTHLNVKIRFRNVNFLEYEPVKPS